MPTFNGTSGNDSAVYGGTTADIMFGGQGNDTLSAGGGNDTVFGGAGADVISAGDGDDTVDGGVGSDVIGGEAGDDTLGGNDGNDAISAGTGLDLVFGGAGADTVAGGAGNDNVQGGADNDLVYGDDGNDAVSGDAGADTVYGGTGNDQVYGGDGDDQLFGELNADLLYGGSGSDTLSGGTSDDWLYGGVEADTLSGGDGADFLFGGDGSDVLAGDAGADAIYGEAGSDTIFAGSGDNIFGGEDGTETDVLVLNAPDVLSITYGGGNDEAGTVTFVDGGTAAFAQIESIQFTGVIDGTTGNDSIGAGYSDSQGDQIDGSDGVNDLVQAGAGNDTVAAGAGTDTVFGGIGDDTLSGEAGNDLLSGGAGSDTLRGGAGSDILTTGDGADVVVLQSGGGGDTVSDFNMMLVGGRTVDQLDVSELTNANGDPVTWSDVTVTDTNSDGTGDAILTFPGGESVILQGIGPDQVNGKHDMARLGIPCFVEGTPILTPSGLRAVETLWRGDLVSTCNGPARVLWAGSRRLGPTELTARPWQLPVCFGVGTIGNTLPLRLSPQHAVRIVSTDGSQALVRAKHLVEAGLSGIRVARGARSVAYHHLLLERHGIVFAAGAAVESLYPGRMALAAFPSAMQLAITAAVNGAHKPAITTLRSRVDLSMIYGDRCFPLLNGRQFFRIHETRKAVHSFAEVAGINCERFRRQPARVG